MLPTAHRSPRAWARPLSADGYRTRAGSGHRRWIPATHSKGPRFWMPNASSAFGEPRRAGPRPSPSRRRPGVDDAHRRLEDLPGQGSDPERPHPRRRAQTSPASRIARADQQLAAAGGRLAQLLADYRDAAKEGPTSAALDTSLAVRLSYDHPDVAMIATAAMQRPIDQDEMHDEDPSSKGATPAGNTRPLSTCQGAPARCAGGASARSGRRWSCRSSWPIRRAGWRRRRCVWQSRAGSPRRWYAPSGRLASVSHPARGIAALRGVLSHELAGP